MVVTSGVDENKVAMRDEVCSDMEYMCIHLDEMKNNSVFGEEAVISMPNSSVTVMVVPTDEEYTIASDTQSILGKK